MSDIRSIARKHAERCESKKRHMREVQQARYKMLRGHGLCVRCKAPVSNGGCMCQSCRAAHNTSVSTNRKAARRATSSNDDNRAKWREQYRERKAAGVCVQCGSEHAIPGHILGMRCRLYKNQRRSGARQAPRG